MESREYDESNIQYEDEIGVSEPQIWVEPVQPRDDKETFRRYIRHGSGAGADNKKEAIKALWDFRRTRYKYTPLNEGEIRLLSIHPGKDDAPIECTIAVRNLSEVKKKYQALSYTWGAAPADPAENQITLYDAQPRFFTEVAKMTKAKGKSAGKVFLVHDNLYSALLGLRRENRRLDMWIDAICMNQMPTEEGKTERNLQVRRMAEVYNSAFNVCIWLGSAMDETNMAMDFAKDVVRLENFDDMINDENSWRKWLAFTHLMKFEWFSRRWVVQELALARRATVHCGDKVVDWTDFADAIDLFITKLDQIQSLFPDPAHLTDVEGLGAVVLVKSISNISRKSPDGDIQEHLVGLEALVSNLQFFNASTAHDVIYSLLALAKDTPQKYCTDRNVVSLDNSSEEPDTKSPFKMVVDYKKDLIDVLFLFTKLCIETSRSLDIICRYWAPGDENTTLPSWIKQMAVSAYGTGVGALQGRRNADSLVGAPYRDSRKNYNASRGTFAEVRFEDPAEATSTTIPKPDKAAHDQPLENKRKAEDELLHSPAKKSKAEGSHLNSAASLHQSRRIILGVKGFRLAMITDVSESVAHGVIHRKWLTNAG
jgi:hypothetical protein